MAPGKRTWRWSVLIPAILAALSGPAWGDFIVIPNPYTGDYLTATTKMALPAVGSTYTSLTDGTETITITTSPSPVAMSTIGGAGSSFGWGDPPTVEQSDPLVMFTGPNGNTTTNDVTLTFSVPVTTFGVEMMPNYPTLFFPYTTTAKFYDGSTLVGTISMGLLSPGGARLFAASTTDEQFTSVNLTAQLGSFPFGTMGFDVAQIRYTAAVPEPSTLVLGGIGLALVAGTSLRKRRRGQGCHFRPGR
jgi:hypothetical protein